MIVHTISTLFIQNIQLLKNKIDYGYNIFYMTDNFNHSYYQNIFHLVVFIDSELEDNTKKTETNLE